MGISFPKKKRDNSVLAIIPAAGAGTRMDMDIKKQFAEINGKPVIVYALEVFEECDLIDEIIVVTAHEDIILVQDMVKYFDITKVSKIVAGGDTRQQSVFNGFKECYSDNNFVLVHDSARPLINIEDVYNVIEDAFEYGAAVLGARMVDTVKRADSEGFVKETLNRDELFQIQTPQVIERGLFEKAYQYATDKCLTFTDDVGLVEAYGAKVKITEGSRTNIKLTTPDDLVLIEQMLGYIE